MQTQSTKTSESNKAGAAAPPLTENVRQLVDAKRARAEAALRTAIEQHTLAEELVQRAKAALTAAPTDSKLVNDLRAALAQREIAEAVHEGSTKHRDEVLASLEAAAAKITELSEADRELTALLQRDSDAPAKRVADAIAVICAAVKAQRAGWIEAARLSQRVEGLATAAGLDFRRSVPDYEARLGKLRRAAHSAVLQAGADWRVVRDLIVGY
jgi:hypothetical protein